MVEPTLPKRQWQGYQGERQIIIDKNGVSRAIYRNPNAAQEDHQRYISEKTYQNQGQNQSDVSNMQSSGVSTPQRAAPRAAPSAPMEQAAHVEKLEPNWLQALLQNYANDIPMTLTLDKNSPQVTPEMLQPTDEQLAQMPPDTREGLGRVFFALASRQYGNDTLEGAFLNGTMIKGYLPSELVAYFKKLTGRQ